MISFIRKILCAVGVHELSDNPIVWKYALTFGHSSNRKVIATKTLNRCARCHKQVHDTAFKSKRAKRLFGGNYK